jgi:hypothetical protein
MLTRAQVARRLGKSIATIRRLEGTHLFPSRDSRGVNQFHEDEVERFIEGSSQAAPYFEPPILQNPQLVQRPSVEAIALEETKARMARLEREVNRLKTENTLITQTIGRVLATVESLIR